jgi:hypothetical protein
LGTWILLDYIWECDRRCHHAVSGITFQQMMPPASAGGPSLCLLVKLIVTFTYQNTIIQS